LRCCSCCRPATVIGVNSEAAQIPADSVDHKPMLQDLNILTAFVAKTLARNFRSDLGWDRILSTVLLLMYQRQDLSNCLWKRAIQGFLSGHSMPKVLAELIQLLECYG